MSVFRYIYKEKYLIFTYIYICIKYIGIYKGPKKRYGFLQGHGEEYPIVFLRCEYDKPCINYMYIQQTNTSQQYVGMPLPVTVTTTTIFIYIQLLHS